MANGKLGTPGSADLAAATDTLLYTCAAGTLATANIRLCNRNPVSVKVRVAIGTGASPAATDYIEYDTTVPANGVLEDTGIAISPGEKVWVRSDTTLVSARIHGVEE